MYPSANNSDPATDPARASTAIGNNRLSVLLCAWIACVFMFAIVAAGMFYGAHTTGELNSAQGQLQSPPIVQPHTSATGKQNTVNQNASKQNTSKQNTVKQAAQKQPTHHDARPVSHSVFGPRSSAVATGYSDAVYGQVPSQPRTAPHTERQSQTLPQQTRPQAALNYSILPEHVLNRNRSTGVKS